ncbi:putative transcription factor C3H family [Helianthus annuus]|uniref:Putative cleavage and polyadenylation specificity factor 30 n=1 Tax=Helianthus annuus TaxID=4232 RepID=A0A251S8R5_HELAN|nr:30-kDa cleavage and polyadenylation specificity factor 30 [Helianthus annuus]KAF5764651.1 putative transcription factor C3H family [Helianthus annuus]KAJ0473173.1 putative transcription factor C3H family [Helianthus annuus]
MEDGEGGLSFDFEGGLDAAPTQPTASVPVIHHSTDNGPPSSAAHLPYSAAAPPSSATDPASAATANANFPGRRSYRQTVCRHWLRSLCMKGEACGFLHQYDKSRMPICRFFRLYGECREQDCVYKHTNEDIKECNMYKLGFCPNGPDCRYRHAKLPGPPPSVEEVLQKIQQLTSYNYGNSNRFFQNRNANNSQQSDKFQFPQGNNDANQGAKPSTTDSASMQPAAPLSPHQQQQVSQLAQSQAQSNGQQNQANKTAIPLPQGTSRYFIVKSCNRENFELSVQQGVWATQRSNEAKLNEAFDSVENVILIFSVNRTRHFQGCAKMTSKTGGSVGGGNWKSEHGTAHYGRNFCVRWLKLCELSFHKTRHLRNPYNENLPVKISRDCQELEPSIGEQLASLLYLEPDSELMAISLAAESKREEEKAKGVNLENATENPDIVPFEDNEEEEEEESEEEDDSYEQGFGMAAQGGRGRGRGLWPPHMPLGRGPRPMPGMRGFPPLMNMMGPDGFSYGGVGPDGFPVPDLMNMGPRGFGPFGPRFPGDFQRPPFSNMMFHGRPGPHGNFPGGGFGMMMGPGPGRPPFMGPGGRGGRPGFPQQQQQQLQTSQNTSRTKRDQAGGSGNDRYSGGGDGVTMGGIDDETQPGGGSTLKNGESESEDEAPRRSRHGETKKRRGGSEGDAATASDDKV